MLRVRSLLVIAILIYVSTGVRQIGTDERAVVRRFGRVVARPGPGLRVGLPWPLDRIDQFKVRSIRQLAVGFNPEDDDESGGWLTGDQNIVDIRIIVEYSASANNIDDYLCNRHTAVQVLAREVETLAAEWAAGKSIEAVLLTGRTALPRYLTHRLPGRMNPHRAGLEVLRIDADYVAAPALVRDAFEAVNQAQTAIRTRENQSRQRAAEILREAAAIEFRTKQLAEAYRQEKHVLALSDAESFAKRLNQYRVLYKTNPNILELIWWDEIGETLTGMRLRGRIDLLDSFLSPGGLDLIQLLPQAKE